MCSRLLVWLLGGCTLLLPATPCLAQGESPSPPDGETSAETDAEAEEAEVDSDIIEGATDEARLHFDLAQRYYRTGRFEDSAREFRAAYELSHLSELLYNVYLASREAGDYETAIEALEAYIPTVQDSAVRRGLERRLERARADRGRLPTPSAEPPDEEETEESPTEASASQAREEATPSLAPAVASGPPWEPWVLVGVGAAALLGAAVSGGLAVAASEELDAMCAGPGGCDSGFESVQTRGASLALATDVLLVAGGVVLGAGLIWALIAGVDSGTEASAACSDEGCAARLRGTF